MTNVTLGSKINSDVFAAFLTTGRTKTWTFSVQCY